MDPRILYIASNPSKMNMKAVFAVSVFFLLALTFAVAQDAPAADAAAAPAPEVGASEETADVDVEDYGSEGDEDDDEEYVEEGEEGDSESEECVICGFDPIASPSYSSAVA
jgi:hypothetical protein